MDLISEYKQQQTWRNWRDYLAHIPLQNSDRVLDLGCSVGNVSHLLSALTKELIGVDMNPDFIDFCQSHKAENQKFVCSDFTDFDVHSLPSVNGIWSSFALSYLAEPQRFINELYDKLEQGGWIALLDVCCFISGNMSIDSEYYQKVKQFELTSHESGVYDFNFGAKLASLLSNSGFTITYLEKNVTDIELNFSGAAEPKVIEVWQARLGRMVKLKALLGDDFSKFEKEFIAHLQSDEHQQRNSLTYCVAVKS